LTYRDTVPFGPKLRRSTEQILHPERYRVGDQRWRCASRRRAWTVVWEDNLGEFEAGSC